MPQMRKGEVSRSTFSGAGSCPYPCGFGSPWGHILAVSLATTNLFRVLGQNHRLGVCNVLRGPRKTSALLTGFFPFSVSLTYGSQLIFFPWPSSTDYPGLFLSDMVSFIFSIFIFYSFSLFRFCSFHSYHSTPRFCIPFHMKSIDCP